MSKGFDEYVQCDFEEHFDHCWEIDWARKPHELRHLDVILQRIRAIAERGHYDLIHVHTPVAAMMTRYALRNHRYRGHTKVLYTAHGFHFFAGAPKVSGAVYKRLEETASRWTDYLVVMNEEDRIAAQGLHKISQDRIVYMPGIGIDLDRYRRTQDDRQAVRDELGFTVDQTMLMCVAEFLPRKRQADILYALKLLDDRRFTIAFAGEGEMLAEVKRLVVTLGLSDQVRFLGLRLDIPRLLSATDCCVLPSSQEGLPRSIMEAMCNGVPVVATDIRGTRELIGDGAGSTYPVGDIPALADAIRRTTGDPATWRAYVQCAFERIETYDVKSVMAMHEDLYVRALGVNREDVLPPKADSERYLL